MRLTARFAIVAMFTHSLQIKRARHKAPLQSLFKRCDKRPPFVGVVLQALFFGDTWWEEVLWLVRHGFLRVPIDISDSRGDDTESMIVHFRTPRLKLEVCHPFCEFPAFNTLQKLTAGHTKRFG